MLSYFIVCSYFVFSSNANFSFNTLFYFSVSMIIFNPSEWVSLAKKLLNCMLVKPKCTTANIVINIDITNTSKKNESVQKRRELQRRNL